LIILLILFIVVIFIVIVYFAKRSGVRSKKQEEGKDLIKEAEGETKTGLSVDAVSVTLKRGLGFGPIECPSCGRYITEPLETRDSKNDALVMVCPYCGNRI
jgi:DNA-directed RNA polymerase subunit RPC12/RpoP